MMNESNYPFKSCTCGTNNPICPECNDFGGFNSHDDYKGVIKNVLQLGAKRKSEVDLLLEIFAVNQQHDDLKFTNTSLLKGLNMRNYSERLSQIQNRILFWQSFDETLVLHNRNRPWIKKQIEGLRKTAVRIENIANENNGMLYW